MSDREFCTECGAVVHDDVARKFTNLVGGKSKKSVCLCKVHFRKQQKENTQGEATYAIEHLTEGISHAVKKKDMFELASIRTGLKELYIKIDEEMYQWHASNKGHQGGKGATGPKGGTGANQGGKKDANQGGKGFACKGGQSSSDVRLPKPPRAPPPFYTGPLFRPGYKGKDALGPLPPRSVPLPFYTAYRSYKGKGYRGESKYAIG